jgi:hypothetical protein
MTGAVDRALKTQIEAIDAEMLGTYLANADILEDWIKDLRALAHQIMDSGAPVPGYKLVAKRGTRQWTDANKAVNFLGGANIDPWKLREVISPAQAEKELKKRKMTLPDDLVVSVSSGTTLASADDPRPAVLQIGKQLTAALSKLQ